MTVECIKVRLYNKSRGEPKVRSHEKRVNVFHGSFLNHIIIPLRIAVHQIGEGVVIQVIADDLI